MRCEIGVGSPLSHDEVNGMYIIMFPLTLGAFELFAWLHTMNNTETAASTLVGHRT